MQATRLQPGTRNWAAGSKLSKGEISQEDYKKVIQGEMELEEAVRRVEDGEVESAITVQRRKAEKQAAERRAALRETRERMTESATIETQEQQPMTEITAEPVEEDQAYEETDGVEEIEIEAPAVEEPKWDVVVIQPDGTAEVVDELGGKLAAAKVFGQQIFDENGGTREVRVRSYADEKTKKTIKPNVKEEAGEKEKPAKKEKEAPGLWLVEVLDEKATEVVKVLFEAIPRKDLLVEADAASTGAARKAIAERENAPVRMVHSKSGKVYVSKPKANKPAA